MVDYKEKKVVNNDYHHLTNHFETAFKPLHKKGAPDLYPEELREEIDKLNVWLFENVNNAVYRAQFAESLQAFKDGYETFLQDLRQWTNGWRIRDSYSEITLQTVTSACIQHLQDLTTAILEISDLAYTDW